VTVLLKSPRAAPGFKFSATRLPRFTRTQLPTPPPVRHTRSPTTPPLPAEPGKAASVSDYSSRAPQFLVTQSATLRAHGRKSHHSAELAASRQHTANPLFKRIRGQIHSLPVDSYYTVPIWSRVLGQHTSVSQKLIVLGCKVLAQRGGIET